MADVEVLSFCLETNLLFDLYPSVSLDSGAEVVVSDASVP